MDGFRLSDKVLLKLEERKGKELIITMAESMSRGAALTFSSLCIATIKKMYQGSEGCVCARLYLSVDVFVSTWQCAHLYVCARLRGSDMKRPLKAKVNGLTVTCS